MIMMYEIGYYNFARLLGDSFNTSLYEDRSFDDFDEANRFIRKKANELADLLDEDHALVGIAWRDGLCEVSTYEFDEEYEHGKIPMSGYVFINEKACYDEEF